MDSDQEQVLRFLVECRMRGWDVELLDAIPNSDDGSLSVSFRVGTPDLDPEKVMRLARKRGVSPTAPESKSASAMVWRGLESEPDFNAELRQAEKDLKAGKGTPFREIRRER